MKLQLTAEPFRGKIPQCELKGVPGQVDSSMICGKRWNPLGLKL